MLFLLGGNMQYDISNYPILDADDLMAMPAVAEFCKDLPLICDEQVSCWDWSQDKPVVVRAFHGTTHLFDDFDVRRASHEGFLGQAIYLTSSHYDCLVNYATVHGPDLQSNIEREAERLADLIAEDPDAYHCKNDSDHCVSRRARELAEDKFIGETERVIETLVKIERPFIIAPKNTKLHQPVFPGLDDLRDDARRDTCLDHGIDPDDFEAQERIQDLIFEAMDAVEDQSYDRLQMAYLTALQDLVDPVWKCPEGLALDGSVSDLTTQELFDIVRSNESLLDLTNDDGQLVSSSIVTRMALHLGFDSIILINANEQFRMEMDHHTTHIHLLDNRPGQVLQLNRDLREAEDLAA
jgi:hypothetical protein